MLGSLKLSPVEKRKKKNNILRVLQVMWFDKQSEVMRIFLMIVIISVIPRLS